MKSSIIAVVILILPLVLGALFVYSKVDACGWRGLFVECRIVECAP